MADECDGKVEDQDGRGEDNWSKVLPRELMGRWMQETQFMQSTCAVEDWSRWMLDRIIWESREPVGMEPTRKLLVALLFFFGTLSHGNLVA